MKDIKTLKDFQLEILVTVKAVVVPIPFTQSFNANTRESEVLAVLNK